MKFPKNWAHMSRHSNTWWTFFKMGTKMKTIFNWWKYAKFNVPHWLYLLKASLLWHLSSLSLPISFHIPKLLYLHPFDLWCFPVLCTSLILLITSGSDHLKFQKSNCFQKSNHIGLWFFEKIQNQKKVQFRVFENFQNPVPVFWKLSESKEPGKIYYRNSKN